MAGLNFYTSNRLESLAEKLAGVLRNPLSKLAQDLDEFFDKIPKDTRYHIELRTEAYSADPVLDDLKKHGVGVVFSHWTWLPPLRK